MRTYDLLVVGAGPAGMTAAIYGVRANLSVLLVDKLAPGGQIINTKEVENYLGFGKIEGVDLALKMFEHCIDLDVEFDYKTVDKIEDRGDIKIIHCQEDEEKIGARAVIIASGTRPRKLNVDGEDRFAGSAISWCAICDGPKYRDKDVVIIGGGNSAVDEGTYLADMVKNLTIITDFDLTADPASCNYLRSFANVKIHPYKKVLEFLDDGSGLVGVKFADKETGLNEQIVKCHGVFEYIGLTPSTEFIKDLPILDDHGYIRVDEKMQTEIDGIYGAGDCNKKTLRQIATAVSDGALAGQEVAGYIKNLKIKEKR